MVCARQLFQQCMQECSVSEIPNVSRLVQDSLHPSSSVDLIDEKLFHPVGVQHKVVDSCDCVHVTVCHNCMADL
jgi:hypothetical protein